jgi:hypothetical protein
MIDDEGLRVHTDAALVVLLIEYHLFTSFYDLIPFEAGES